MGMLVLSLLPVCVLKLRAVPCLCQTLQQNQVSLRSIIFLSRLLHAAETCLNYGSAQLPTASTYVAAHFDE